MEGTVTISIKDFDRLRGCDEIMNWLKITINEEINEKGTIRPEMEHIIVDRLVGKLYL